MMLAVNLARYGHSEEIEERRDVSSFFPRSAFRREHESPFPDAR